MATGLTITVEHFDLVIVGTGSGNSILDQRFADMKVAIVEKGTFGGTCLNVGCIPTKMFVHTADVATYAANSERLGVDAELAGVRWADVRDRIFGRIDPIAEGGRTYRIEHPDNANVTVFEGVAHFTGERKLEVIPNDGSAPHQLSADRIVLAAGSRPIIPDLPGLDQVEYHTSDTVMRLDKLPESAVILGSGTIAAEFAHVLSSFGVKVTMIARTKHILRDHDSAISERITDIATRKWDVRLESHATAVRTTESGVALELSTARGPETVEAELLLIAIGRKPNADLLNVEAGGIRTVDGRVWVDQYQRTSAEGVYALGDLSSPDQLKHVANHEARVVQHNLLHPDDPVAANHEYIPQAVFTSPQIATVGRTEEQLRAQGVPYVVGTQNYSDVAYGWAMEDTTGFAKVIADPETGLLLGVHIIGPQAPTVIQPAIQAMSFGLDAKRMARGQYWIHPAMPEVLENALLNLPL